MHTGDWSLWEMFAQEPELGWAHAASQGSLAQVRVWAGTDFLTKGENDKANRKKKSQKHNFV